LVVLGLAFWAGRKSAPAPIVVPSTPKTFGLAAAETVRAQLGDLSPVQAQAAHVAAIVGGLDWTLPQELAATRDSLARDAAKGTEAVARLAAQIAQTEGSIAATKARDTEVASVGQAFGLPA
jgi:hypothetical protein